MRDLNPNAQVLMIGMDTDENALVRVARADVSGCERVLADERIFAERCVGRRGNRCDAACITR
jgi:hypothetical protein